MDEDFTSPLSMSDLPFQGAIKLRSIKVPNNYEDVEDIMEYTNASHGKEESFPNIKEMNYPNIQQLAEDGSLYQHVRGEKFHMERK